MKKYFSIILRFLFAAAGITYIAFTLTWVDTVVLPAGYARDEGEGPAVVQPETYRVKQLHEDGSVTAWTQDGAGEFTLPAAENADMGATGTQAYEVRPGIVTAFRKSDWKLLLFGFLLVGPVYVIQSWRWWILLRARGLDVPFGSAFRLTMVGSFFNYCLPGTTGGDVVKAYYAAKRAANRSDAVMTVIFDRVTGLMGLVLLAGLAGLLLLDHPMARQVTMYVWFGMAALAMMSAIYFSRRLRRKLGLQWVIDRLPAKKLVQAVDQSAVAFAQPRHKRVVLTAWLVSVLVHMMLTSAAALSGYALGMDVGWTLLLVVVPLIFLAAAVPLTYQGLGVMEGLGVWLLVSPPEVTANHIVGMFLMVRVYQIVYSLMGSLFLLKGDIHLHPEAESLEEVAEGDASDDKGEQRGAGDQAMPAG